MSENRQRTGPRRVPRTAFRPGQSGNPGGRPKKTQEEYDLEKACEAKAPLALKMIVALMEKADKDSVRLAAATFIIERRYGKAVQLMIEQTPTSPLEDATIATLLTMKQALEDRMTRYERKALT